jgi:hypothetical protein
MAAHDYSLDRLSKQVHTTAAPSSKSVEPPMNRIFAACAAAALMASSARAEISPEAARDSVAPFYKALNAEFANDSAELIRQSTALQWVSCRGNDICNSRDEVIAGVGQRLKSVPDLKWEIKEVLVSGNQVTVRGEATGTPAAEFMGTPHSGKSFKLMSIDVHTLEGGKMVRSYHIERLDRSGPSAFGEVSRPLPERLSRTARCDPASQRHSGGRAQHGNPESRIIGSILSARDSPMCNRTSEVHAPRAPE